ncbi:MAG: DUF192 domain-containing protein [Nanoarchaeota archaeon]|nr:DUF192 domain-containing protein [Nanoarchaeota archaeon]
MKLLYNDVILANDVKHYTNIFSRFKGLRFSKPLKKKQAAVFTLDEESISGTTIDMLFVFFPIDVLWLNKEKKVVDIRRNVKPFTPIAIPKKPAKYIIEMKTGMTNNIKIGDKIRF